MVDTRRYRAYLLRGWLEVAAEAEHDVWRFRLQDVRSGDEWGFASLEAVNRFFEEKFAQDDEADD